MGLACKITGHKWEGCVCARCGERRDEGHAWNKLANGSDGCTCERCGRHRDEGHDYRDVKRGASAENLCGLVCAMCKSTKWVPHEWNGCICPRCGAKRDEGHKWLNAESNGASGHLRKCQTCGSKELEPHAFASLPNCRRRCSECWYETVSHEFRGGECMNCGIDESNYYCNLILSGKVRYGGSETGIGSAIYGDHIRSVPALRKIALSGKVDYYHRGSRAWDSMFDCIEKLSALAAGSGPDAHAANLALRDIVLNPSSGWYAETAAKGITDPKIASNPKVVRVVGQVKEASVQYDNTMIASDR